MTEATIALREYLHKLGMDEDQDFLRESVRVMSQMLMELEIERKPARLAISARRSARHSGTAIGSAVGRRGSEM